MAVMLDGSLVPGQPPSLYFEEVQIVGRLNGEVQKLRFRVPREQPKGLQ